MTSLTTMNWTPVFVAMISAIGAVVVPFWLWRQQGKKESVGVLASLLAEVSALVEIVNLDSWASSSYAK